jgi:hypothetical protein
MKVSLVQYKDLWRSYVPGFRVVGRRVVGRLVVGFDVGIRVVGFDVGRRVVGRLVVGFDVGIRVVGFDVGIRVVGSDVGIRVVGFDDVGIAVGFRVDVGVPVGLEVYGTHGALWSSGIVLVNARFPSNIRCASPVKRRYQSEGKDLPSASKANQPPAGRGRSFVLAVTLKIAVASSTSSN